MANKFFVSNKDESPRMFKSDFMDLFSRVHWTVPMLVWLPVVVFSLGWSVRTFGFHWWYAPVFLAAVFAWTFAEYFLHRFVFHYHPSSEVGKRIHFIAHGVHHDYPNDSKRLVMPPVLSIPLGILFFFFYQYTLGQYHLVFFAGFVLGYIIYDTMHYALHHFNVSHPIFKRLKEHHMIHHYSDPDRGYGVSSDLWDQVFRTTFQLDKKKNSAA
jgi:4-hydroxysphinganine ceramide fatty acyl 2-hydroxylase